MFLVHLILGNEGSMVLRNVDNRWPYDAAHTAAICENRNKQTNKHCTVMSLILCTFVYSVPRPTEALNNIQLHANHKTQLMISVTDTLHYTTHYPASYTTGTGSLSPG